MSAVPAAIALAAVTAALMLGRRAWRLSRGVATEGVIVGYDERRDSDGLSFVPLIEFDVPGTGRQRIESIFARSTMGPSGVPVRVRYDPADPSRADLDGALRTWLPVAAMLLFGAAFLFAAVG